jgi:hypothetical protein
MSAGRRLVVQGHQNQGKLTVSAESLACVGYTAEVYTAKCSRLFEHVYERFA